MITNIEDYFAKGCGRCDRFDTEDCSARLWQTGLATLRQICLDTGLSETVKWGHPCYMHSGRNIAVIGAFRGDFRLSFFNAALMKDPDHVLEKQGQNTAHPDMIRFTNPDEVTGKSPVIQRYLKEAMQYAEDGIRPPRDKDDLVLPEELLEALETDPDLKEAFHRLTPGRQKSYVLNLNSAKKPETRHARITKFRDKIFAGKGALER